MSSQATTSAPVAKAHVDRQRHELLRHVDQALSTPITFLSFIWLAVVIGALFHPADRALTRITWVIWGVFVFQFVVEIIIAPGKIQYVKKHWITAISLLLPAFGIFRVVPVFQLLLTAHSGGYMALAQLLGSANRGLRALGHLIQRRGLGYVLGLVLIVMFGGAAGIQFFESPGAVRAVGGTGGITSFGDALWYSSMQLTTAGSGYVPVTAEGRIIAWLITAFGVSVAGYITAAVATYLVGKDRLEGDNAAASGTS